MINFVLQPNWRWNFVASDNQKQAPLVRAFGWHLSMDRAVAYSAALLPKTEGANEVG